MFILLIAIAIFNIYTGSISIPFKEIWNVVTNNPNSSENYQYIITEYRLPKTVTSILVGIGLGISGLLMQTFFRNPLAGPFVLGISSGASLGVALLIMGGSFFGSLPYLYHFSIPLAASLGSFFVLSIVMITARNIRNTMSILIIGLMFGSFTTAIISVLSYFSSATELQQYIFWSFGSLGNLQWSELYLLIGIVSISAVGLLFIIKPLDALLLGENYATSLGISIKKTQSIIFIVTSLLTGSITAFVGPIAFIGLAIPHITKLIFQTSNHKILLPAVGIIGAIVMLICDSLTHISVGSKTLPINAITSIFGAPIVIWLLVSKSKKIGS
ncbi:FecCD family ABC transporter permease [Wenyingzhuangia fucanilytica]|uniref:FecCD family ABC transporter permease n=1 Tax=Wenyingzhuangia fucanilytica TaxID=1790137 RepID=UPI001F2D419C|nr:iron ABC transporter permease [Wenyingzhuangia fucanilytica]